MTSDATLPEMAARLADTVRLVMSEIQPKLVHAALSGERGEHENRRHTDNFLSEHDLAMHQRYKELLTGWLGSFVYASEEAEPEIIGTDTDPDLCVLVDPLDTSELAVRGLLGYTHAMIYSRQLRRPIVSVVGDIYHHIQLFIGARDEHGADRAYAVTADGATYTLLPPARSRLAESMVTNYLMRPGERFLPLAGQHNLINALDQPAEDGKSRGRIGVDFGSVGLCHVAAGFTEAMIEFAKGFAIWDLAPGHYILHAAGGTVVDLHGVPIPLDYQFDSLADIGKAMDRRQKFVAAGTSTLAGEILDLLDPSDH